MNTTYLVAIVASTIALAVLTDVRIAYVMSKRWGLSFDPGTITTCVSTGIATGAVAWVSSLAIIKSYGLLAGLIAAPLSVLFVGIVWLFLVGANKAIERILDRLLKRVS